MYSVFRFIYKSSELSLLGCCICLHASCHSSYLGIDSIHQCIREDGWKGEKEMATVQLELLHWLDKLGGGSSVFVDTNLRSCDKEVCMPREVAMAVRDFGGISCLDQSPYLPIQVACLWSVSANDGANCEEISASNDHSIPFLPCIWICILHDILWTFYSGKWLNCKSSHYKFWLNMCTHYDVCMYVYTP